MLGAHKIHRITETNSEEISDREILISIIDLGKASKTLTGKRLSYFQEHYDRFYRSLDPFPANLQKYYDRAFAIGYDFSLSNISFSDICKEGVDEKLQFSKKWDQYTEWIESLCQDYHNHLHEFIAKNNLENSRLKVDALSTIFFKYLLFFAQADNNLRCQTEFFPAFFSNAYALYKIVTEKPYANSINQYEEFQLYQNKMEMALDVALTAESIPEKVASYAHGFVTLCGVSNDIESERDFLRLTASWSGMAKNDNLWYK